MIYVTYKYGDNNWIEMSIEVTVSQDLNYLMRSLSETSLKIHDNFSNMEYTCKPFRVEYRLSV